MVFVSNSGSSECALWGRTNKYIVDGGGRYLVVREMMKWELYSWLYGTGLKQVSVWIPGDGRSIDRCVLSVCVCVCVCNTS